MSAPGAGTPPDASPLVSVIVPAYNAAATLAATLASAQAQTHAALEIFVVDDGSQDDTAAIADRLAAADHRIKVIRRDNGGVARARNTALARARGAYVAWLDADDLWHPAKIASQLRMFGNACRPLAFVYTGYRLIDVEDRILPNPRPLSDVSGATLCRQIATNFFTNVSSIMVPSGLARRVGGHDPRLRDAGMEGAEDLLMQLRLAALGPAGCCRRALVGYRMHGSNMSLGHLRAARSNLRAIELVAQETPAIPDWVLRLARARVVGYAGHSIAQRDIAGGLALVTRLARQQTPETLTMALRVAGLAARRALGGARDPDPAVGTQFLEADPDTAPWSGHMLQSEAERRRLVAADAELARAQARRGARPTLPLPLPC